MVGMIPALVAALAVAVAVCAWLLVTRRPPAPGELPADVMREAVLDAVARVTEHTERQSATVLQATAERLAAVTREQLAAEAARAELALAGKQEILDQTLASRQELVDRDLTLRQQQLDQRLGEVQAGVRSDMERLAALVQQLGEATSERFGQVDTSLRAHAEIAQSLAGTTNSLREALASSNARGQWGERLADDVLRAAGFREGINYVKRTALSGDAAGIPDFTFIMPKGQVMFMDVKFPMAAYLKYLEAASDAERSAHRATFLRDVRARVRELAKRQYAAADDRPAVDTVLMFVPNETVSGFILESDHGLLDEAMADQVVICSPMTLFAFLGVIRQAFDNFALEQTSQEILGLLGKFGQQWTKYAETVDKVRRQFDTVARSFDELATTRRRALERPLAQIEDIRLRNHLPLDGQLFQTDTLDELPSNVRELGA
jgi:DNA recombination protein RmuC